MPSRSDGRGPLLRVAIAVLSSLVALPAAAQQEPPPGWHHYGSWGWMFMGPLMMVAFVAAVVVLVILALRWLAGTGHHGLGAPPPVRTPLDILKERFARGEIDKAEFEERRRLLQD